MSRPVGAYGLQLAGVDGAESLLVDADASWPLVQVATTVGRERLEAQSVGPSSASIAPGDLVVHLERDPGRARVVSPTPLPLDAVVHPLLAHIASIHAWWRGRESLHAGAVVVGGATWAVLGGRSAGKSTTLAWLAQQGLAVVTDDLLVLDGDVPFVGPRAIDLRADAAQRLGTADYLGLVGERERWRLTLPRIAAVAPLAGLVTLAWGEDVATRPLRLEERIEAIGASRSVLLPPADPARWLDLAGLRWVELTRPPSWDALPRVADELARIAG